MPEQDQFFEMLEKLLDQKFKVFEEKLENVKQIVTLTLGTQDVKINNIYQLVVDNIEKRVCALEQKDKKDKVFISIILGCGITIGFILDLALKFLIKKG